MSEPRVVKRYANRKLYDTQRSRYVTLDQIAEMIRGGQDVKIIDNTSKEDLTSITLAQIIFEQEKKQNSFLPLAAMKNIIQSGGESLQELASVAGARVRQVFRREGEGGPIEGAPLAPIDGVPAAAEAATDDAHGAELPHSMLRDLVERSQVTFDEWQKRVDERVQKVVEALAPWTALEKEVVDLRQRLAELEHRLSESESPAGTGGPSASEHTAS
jgi:polyhydroxyalkanoate synthesis repressor PhaR